MQAFALIVVTAAGLWLVAVASLMALRPLHCLHLLEMMRTNLLRSNWRLQWIEQGLRILAGAALIVRAPESRLPLAFQIAGWILVVTSSVILIAPHSLARRIRDIVGRPVQTLDDGASFARSGRGRRRHDLRRHAALRK